MTGALGYTPLSTGGGTVTANLAIQGATATSILSLLVSGSTIWSLGVGDASGSNFGIGADFGRFTINKLSGNITTPGQFYAGSNNLVLHAGNYSSYALPLSGGTLTGKAAINLNSRSTSYIDSNFEVYTGDNTPPGISFHRGGYSATLLYEYDGELYVNAWTTRGQSGKLLSSGNSTSYQSKEIRALRYTNADFNTLGTTANGFSAYTNYIPTGGSYNQPPNGAGDYRVIQWGGLGEGAQTGFWGGQIVQNFYDDRMWFRRQAGQSWQAWLS